MSNPSTQDRRRGFTRFMRTFLPWQMWRFAMINLKMMSLMRKSHHGGK